MTRYVMLCMMGGECDVGDWDGDEHALVLCDEWILLVQCHLDNRLTIIVEETYR